MDFEVGDDVQLNSGGDYMNVVKIEGDQVTCTWFKNGEKMVDVFDAALLGKALSPSEIVGILYDGN